MTAFDNYNDNHNDIIAKLTGKAPEMSDEIHYCIQGQRYSLTTVCYYVLQSFTDLKPDGTCTGASYKLYEVDKHTDEFKEVDDMKAEFTHKDMCVPRFFTKQGTWKSHRVEIESDGQFWELSVYRKSVADGVGSLLNEDPIPVAQMDNKNKDDFKATYMGKFQKRANISRKRSSETSLRRCKQRKRD